ncbi:EamA family transporter [Paenibacillus alvei]|uniref:EamA family transporter n=1 Tax=Paenibacillus alvei TaxID=44250 RepID=UPI0018CFE151|nr:DMT family transporter [Paenibacillus alvei]MBG9737144.1 multidrug transporter [Paenibacillus alvei]MBG9746237.1 multidrug transporter [Paenibacillus alvei]MCY9579647.1 DMT family transporter [Paenibacillus alvei]MCY9586301.1 DMT family transporter [Paenibacillus alvei]
MKLLQYALLVFLGACSYGTLSSIMKLGIREGFTVPEIVGGQYFFGWLMLVGMALLFSRYKLRWKQAAVLLACGLSVSCTSITYGLAVGELPASIAVVFLFQFTWIGVLLESIVTRTRPERMKVISVVILLVGTVFAGGLADHGLSGLSWKGSIFGMISAISFAVYIFVSGRVATDVPILTKSLSMITGAMLVVFLMFPPAFIFDGTLSSGLWKFGLPMGLLGIIIPVIFFGIGVPKIGSGLGTILGAAELPAAVIMSVLVLREQVTVLQWAGIVLIFAGICLPQLTLFQHKRLNTEDVTERAGA